MSLYGGIKFNIGDGQQLEKPSSGSSSPKQSTETGSHQDGAGDPAQSAFTGSESKVRPSAQPSKPATKPSAALKFAPRIRQPRPAAGPSTTYSAEPVFVDTLRPEPPTSASTSSAKGKSHEVVFGNDGKALAKAPAMTLVAGGGKRERGKEEEQRRKLKKKQRVRSGWNCRIMLTNSEKAAATAVDV
jgi:splicing factor 45